MRQVGSSQTRITSRDVAQVAGVSQATVSNAINRPELVAPETLTRVLAAIDETGFIPNRHARALRAGRTSTVGLVVLDLSNPFWGSIARGVESGASEFGMNVMVSSSDESAEKEQRLVRALEEQQVSAIIVSPVEPEAEFLHGVRERGTRVVLIDIPHPTHEFPSVSYDHVLGAKLVGEFLIGQGHTSVAFINGPRSVPWCRDRLLGLRAAFADAGLDPDSSIAEITVESMTASGGADAVGSALQLQPRPTAVFAGNDVMALGVLRGLGENGLAVPADISVIGYDDVATSQMLSPPLTTVRQDAHLIGYLAAQKALSLGDSRDEVLTMSPTLIVRESVTSRL